MTYISDKTFSISLPQYALENGNTVYFSEQAGSS